MKVSTDIDSSAIDAFLDEHIGSTYTYMPVSGGLVHHVYKVSDKKREYFLKIRGTNFAKMPTVVCNPEEIEYEYRALKRFHEIDPKAFPEIIAYDQAKSMILMLSVMTPDINLEFLLNTGMVNNAAAERIARLIAKVHSTLQNDKTLIKGEREQAYYADNLYYRLSSLGRESLVKAVESLRKHRKQVIFGDLSPKNMAIDAKGVYVCDLDAAHYGNVLFDVGFFAGHLLLHSFNQPDSHVAEAFIKAYLSNSELYIDASDEDILARIMIGTCIYRLDNSIVPYNVPNLTSDEQKELLGKMDDLLLRDILTVKKIGNVKV